MNLRGFRFQDRGFLRCISLAVPLALILNAAAACAQETKPSSVEQALQKLRDALEPEPGLTPQTKQALREVLESLRSERTRGSEAVAPTAAPLPVSKGEVAKAVDEYLATQPITRDKTSLEKAFEQLSFYGDLRLRHESNFNLDDQPDRHRERVRLRFGTGYEVTDELSVGVRLTTGNADDPKSPHTTLGNGFKNFGIALDRAFATYRPLWLKGAVGTAGKFAHPFYQNPVYSELVWDADVQPEGAVAGYSISGFGRLTRLDFWAGEYVVLEQSLADESLASVAQVSAQFNVATNLTANLAVGYYYYTDPTPDGASTIFKANAGNATVDRNGDATPDAFASDFGILNPIVALTYNGWELPLTVSAEYILNTRAVGDTGQGWATGIVFGRAQKKGDWRLYYQWQVVEQDAVFSPFAQDDFLLGTNHRSHLFGANYQLLDKLGLHLWALVSARDRTFPALTTDSDAEQWRVRLDANIRF